MLSAVPAPPCLCLPDWTGRPSRNLATVSRWWLRKAQLANSNLSKHFCIEFSGTSIDISNSQKVSAVGLQHSVEWLFPVGDSMLWNRAMGKSFLSSLVEHSIWQWWEAPCSSAHITQRLPVPTWPFCSTSWLGKVHVKRTLNDQE